MDLFERAHVVRIPPKTPPKDQYAIKNKLKIMLQGYKNSDHELIKDAEDASRDFEDSTSVSGFSDLNLTVSSAEDSTANVISQTNSPSTQASELNVSMSECKISKEKNGKVNCHKQIPNLQDSENSALKYTTLDISSNDGMTSNKVSNDENYILSPSADISYISSDDTNSSTGSGLCEFDPEGKLALMIHEKLLHHKALNQKRGMLDDELSPIKEKKSRRDKNSKQNQDRKSCDNDELLIKNYEDEEQLAIKLGRQESVTTSKDEVRECVILPPSILLSEIDGEKSFNQFLGEYKNEIIRNLPAHYQNPTFYIDSNTKNSDDMSSLIPEVDNDLRVLDLEDIDNNQTSNTVDNVTNIDETSLIETSVPTETNLPLNIMNDSEHSEPNNNFKIYFGHDNCVIVFKHPSELYLHGMVIAKAIAGKLEVFGHILTEIECPIIAPLYSYAQTLKTIENANQTDQLYDKLKACGVLSSDAIDISEDFNESDGILLLKPMRHPQMDFVSQNFNKVNLFKDKSKEHSLQKASEYLGCTLYSAKPQRAFIENPLWQRVLSSSKSITTCVVCGGKGSGKSTFLRYYTNKVLNKGPILVIDLDPGQSEFTVAGNVSATVVTKPIFGPSFTHLKHPNISLNIGMISTMDNIHLYINAVKSVITYSREHFNTIPWIINTMGMTNNVGLKLMIIIILLAQPDYVLQYDSKNPKKCFDTRFTPDNVEKMFNRFKYEKQFVGLTSTVTDYSLIMAPEAEILQPNKSPLIPRDERYLSFLAYFAQLFQNSNDSRYWLLGATPYEVPLKDLYVAVNIKVKKDCITKVINGKVVALCQQATQSCERVFTLADKPLLCHGHGLVRGIDWEKEILYIITPIAASELPLVNTILYADWVPDLRGQEQCLPDGTEVPYRTPNELEQAAFMSTPRRRFNPMQLIKMMRNRKS
ncbi:unnamed protein product [Leptosia nina]|uniref:Polynucleotide 5'-hydroxyl-kinase NOL9 n=1 Tax=Leptosia nina TaxID=320188 RepID=A0AAV1JMP0_9NEOP